VGVASVVAGCTGVNHEGAGAEVGMGVLWCMVLLVSDGLFVNSSSSIALLNGGVVAGDFEWWTVYSVNELLKK